MSELSNPQRKKFLTPKARSRKSMSYRKSREVILVDSEKGKNSTKYVSRSMSKVGRRWRKFSRAKRCPKAPHNTTSFLMNFHKSETKQHQPIRGFIEADNDCDSIGMGLLAYGTFFPKFKSIPADMMSLYSNR